MIKILHSYILQALGINEKGIYNILNDSISNFDLEVFNNLNTFSSAVVPYNIFTPTVISYLKGFLNLTESECSYSNPL
jgi:hypothetical protein